MVAHAHSVEAVLPLRPVELEILLALAREDLHGYGLMKAVEAQSQGLVRLEVGSLYRILSRMLATGLITDDQDAAVRAADRGRRRCYRITRFGLRVAAAEVGRLRLALMTANAVLR